MQNNRIEIKAPVNVEAKQVIDPYDEIKFIRNAKIKADALAHIQNLMSKSVATYFGTTPEALMSQIQNGQSMPMPQAN